MYQGKFGPSGAAAPVKSHAAPVTVGTIVFYTFYVVLVLAFCLAAFLGLRWLNRKLTEFEDAQPQIRAEEVYQEYFRNPMWENLYASAGFQDTAFESAASFAAFMEERRAGRALAYIPAGNASGELSYLLQLGEDTIASFTLINQNPQTGKLPAIPDWQFARFELYPQRDQSYTILVPEGHALLVNGIPPSEEHLQSITQDASGIKTLTYVLEGFFCPPQVSVAAKDGTVKEMVYEENSHRFLESTLSPDQSQGQGRVKLTFMVEETAVFSEFYHSEATEVIIPLLSTPKNQAFLGWYRKVPDSTGGFSWEQVFPPESSGRVTLPEGRKLTPMTLYAQYETIGGNE